MPKDAKYSKSSIQQDKREAKKRKLDDRRLRHANTQTVRRPGVLVNAITAGISLQREQGSRKTLRSLIDRDAALMKHLVPSRRSITFTELPGWSTEIASMEHCGDMGETVLSLRNAYPGGHSGRTYTLHMLPSKYLEPGDLTLGATPSLYDLSGPYAAFGSPITSISTVEAGNDIVFFASALERASPGNVFSARLVPDTSDQLQGRLSSPYQMTTSNFATLGTTSSTSLWQTSINPAKDTVAVAGTLGVWSLDLECTTKDRLSITRRDYAEPEDDETRAADWLDHHTVAAGSEQVYLWDQRSGGASQRFSCKGRLTGILNPDRGILSSDDNLAAGGRGSGGQTLLISTNRFINLFDVRYVSKSTPLLSWRHEHEGPQIEMMSNGQGLFAAGDRDGYVHVYSTRTGGEVARLGRAEGGRGKGVVGNLRWVEDRDGRFGLRALQGGDVLEWRWDGVDD